MICVDTIEELSTSVGRPNEAGPAARASKQYGSFVNETEINQKQVLPSVSPPSWGGRSQRQPTSQPALYEPTCVFWETASRRDADWNVGSQKKKGLKRNSRA